MTLSNNQSLLLNLQKMMTYSMNLALESGNT